MSHRSLAKDFNIKDILYFHLDFKVFLLKSHGDTLRYSISRIKVDSFVIQESGGFPVLQIRA